jgi:hypothetical protein
VITHSLTHLELYDKAQLKSGETAPIVEIYEQGVAYEANIFVSNGEYKTDTIQQADIVYAFAETSKKAVM